MSLQSVLRTRTSTSRPRSEIVCQMEKPRNLSGGVVGDPMVGYLAVKVKNQYTARSRDQYSFVDPRITSIRPGKGPKSGGTILEILGLHMDAGSWVEAFVGSVPCNVTRRDPDVMVCVTGASFHLHVSATVRVRLDKRLRVFEDHNFLYVEDPTITETGSTGIPKGIPSGGIVISVTGTNLDSVQYPYIYTIVNNEEFNGSCTLESSTSMQCRSPRVPSEILDFPPPGEPVPLEYGFRMDNVEGVRNLSSRHAKFLMYPNPVYHPFSESDGIKYFKSDYLTINGVNLDRAAQESDVVVRIGTSFCNVTSLSRSRLTCRPPAVQPPASGRADASEVPEVVVEVGDHLQFTIGKLSYAEEATASLSQPVMVSVIIAACLLLVAAGVFLLVAHRRKSSRVLQGTKAEVLELRVANGVEHSLLPATAALPVDRELSQSSPGSSRTYQNDASFLEREDLLVFEQLGLLIQTRELTFGPRIGEGHFGQVFKGYLQRPNEDKIEVALKTLRKNMRSDPTEGKAFMQEALIMKDFDDPHVLGLKGICIEGGAPCMVLEYMQNGDLHAYIRGDEACLNVSNLLKFGLDIASGMCYLANKKFVHRDLAARNCVLDSSMRAKVADFGMSRDIYLGNYYRSQDRLAAIPCRWMAPEAIEKGLYTTHTDVWSYGVLLWELVTRGCTPYANVIDNWDVLEYIQRGNRLNQPQFCPEPLYLGMLACWNTDPDRRPSFFELHSYVGEIHDRLLDNSPGDASSATVAENTMYSNAMVPAQNTEFYDSKELYLRMDGHELSKDYLQQG